MPIQNKIILLLYLLGLFIFFISGVIKGFYHVAYLKAIDPQRFNHLNNFFSVFTFKQYNARLQFLFFPIFFRSKEKENNLAKRHLKKIWIFLIINLLSFLILLSPVIVGIMKNILQ